MSWTFDTISFSPAIDGQYIYDTWFERKILYTIDPALGGTRRTVDQGGVTYEPLTLTVQLDSETNRDDLCALLGEQATLTDGDRTASALLVSATPITVVRPASGVFRARLTFEWIDDT